MKCQESQFLPNLKCQEIQFLPNLNICFLSNLTIQHEKPQRQKDEKPQRQKDEKPQRQKDEKPQRQKDKLLAACSKREPHSINECSSSQEGRMALLKEILSDQQSMDSQLLENSQLENSELEDKASDRQRMSHIGQTVSAQSKSGCRIVGSIALLEPYSRGKITRDTCIILETGGAWRNNDPQAILESHDTILSNMHLFESIDNIQISLDNDAVKDSLVISNWSFLAANNLFNGEWIQLIAKSKSKTWKKWVQVFGSDSSFEARDILKVSWFQLYNLLASTWDHDQSLLQPPQDVSFKISKSIQNQEQVLKNIPTARVVEISQRATAFDSLIHEQGAIGIKNWISNLQDDCIVQIGDIIKIQISLDKAKWMKQFTSSGTLIKGSPSSLSPQEWESIQKDIQVDGPTCLLTLYFQVSKIDTMDQKSPKSYKIDPNSTQVILDDRNFIPSISFNAPFAFFKHDIQDEAKESVSNQVFKALSVAFHPQMANSKSSILLKSPENSRIGHDIILDACRQAGIEIVLVDCLLLAGESKETVIATLEIEMERARRISPSVLFLNHLQHLSDPNGEWRGVVKKALQEFMVSTKRQVVLIANIKSDSIVDPSILRYFTSTINIPAPSFEERLSIVRESIEKISRKIIVSPQMLVEQVSRHSAGLNVDEIKALFRGVGANCFERTHPGILSFLELQQDFKSIKEKEKEIYHNYTAITHQDVLGSVQAFRKQHSETSGGSAKIPKVLWSDIGGLEHVKETILETIQLPLTHPHLFQSGAKQRSGVLLYGPPGTGKTLVAKAVATTLGLNFLSVKGPELLNMYIGESEQNVRKVFQKARDSKPCIIFFDEMESVAPARGTKGDSGGVMDRIVSQLLAEIDGMSTSSSGGGEVFVIGATNRPDLLDPALLRPGRFDKMLYLGVCQDHTTQCSLLKALTRKFKLDADCDLVQVSQQCPLTLTGADLYALCTDANLKSISRVIKKVDNLLQEWNDAGPHEGHPHPCTTPYFLEHICLPADYEVVVNFTDFVDALKELVPSLSREEIQRYERLRDKFEPPSQPEKTKPIAVVDRKGKGKMVEH